MGGNNWTSAFALSQWISPTDEDNAPYTHDDTSMLADIKKANAYRPTYVMKDAVFLPDVISPLSNRPFLIMAVYQLV